MNASYFNTQLHYKTMSSVLFSDCNENKVKILYPYFKNQIFIKLQGFLFYFLLMHKIRAQQLLVLQPKKQKLKETISVYVLQKQYVGLAQSNKLHFFQNVFKLFICFDETISQYFTLVRNDFLSL